ncbi:MFS transporter [Cellulomonas sp. S1-8]|uniref:MFS transporter n=1 Tax=Cellulomonas sp. S1-8 TaxID=2904790 RepID=UPI002242F0D7|nr:MFS transporter [Cellulomonas sp. S1-8]UZN02875.1 MFS transporter [Cellulomonas sp. S1-8]
MNATAVLAPTNPRRRLAALSLGQLVSWGVLFYAFIVASPVIAQDTGWSLSLVTGLYSLGLVVSAVAGVAVGRILDRNGPRRIMTAGSLTGAAGLCVVALAPSPAVFAVGWGVVGLAQAAVLYQAAFTVITHRYQERRQLPLLVLTLAGGLASTVFAPVVVALLRVTDWRTTFLVLAGVLAVVTVPLHWFSLERAWVPHPRGGHAEVHTAGTVLRQRRFWMLLLATTAITLSLYTVTLSIIPLLLEKGISYELAAITLGLVGAGQIGGRLLFMVLPRRLPPWLPLAAVALASAAVLLAIALLPGPTWLLVAVAVVAGAIRGTQTLVQANAVSDRWGSANYGSINGLFSAPLTVLLALTPALGPLFADGVGSFAVMTAILAGVAVIGALLARGS